ncbi:MAG: hypothetical protein AAF962_01535 [Actinomycetota bacterium]
MHRRPSSAARRRLLSLAVAVSLTAVACGAVGANGGDQATDEVPFAEGSRVGTGARAGAAPSGAAGVPVGVAVKGSDPDTLAELVDTTGVEPGVVRVFARWDTPFPGDNHRALLDAGYPIHLSVRPRTDGGVTIPWAELATAPDDDRRIVELRAWLETVAAYDGQIRFTLNHEPETTDSAANGTAEDFVGAWRRMVEIRDEVADAETVPAVFVITRGTYANGSVDRWYPGDDVVDLIGVDAYNWYTCQGTDRAWIDPEPLLAPALAFAVERGKPLAVGEIGSTEDPTDPSRKADWIDALDAYLHTEAAAEHIAFVAWFSVHDRGWPDCNWAYDSSPLSIEAFSRLLGAPADD